MRIEDGDFPVTGCWFRLQSARSHESNVWGTAGVADLKFGFQASLVRKRGW